MLMADAGALWRAEQAGLFQPVTDTGAGAADPRGHLRDPEGRWWGFSRRARVIAYDRAKVRPDEVAGYEQLADPRVQGQGLRPLVRQRLQPVLDGRADRALGQAPGAGLGQGRGGQHGAPSPRAATSTRSARSRRRLRGGPDQHLLLPAPGRSTDDGDKAVAAKLALSFPEQAGAGTHVNISGGGLAAHAPHRDGGDPLPGVPYRATRRSASSPGANHEYPGRRIGAKRRAGRRRLSPTSRPIRCRWPSTAGARPRRSRCSTEAGWR